jgi:hypothetical protein
MTLQFWQRADVLLFKYNRLYVLTIAIEAGNS